MFCIEHGVKVAADASMGWEQVTLNALRVAARQFDAVLYLHTKGVTAPSEWNTAWRRSMLSGVVGQWRRCVDAILSGGMDAVGCHWLTPEQWPELVTVPYFGGNFWWGYGPFLATCTPPLNTSRYEAEVWLGRNDPTVLDLAPGWPSPQTLIGESHGLQLRQGVDLRGDLPGRVDDDLPDPAGGDRGRLGGAGRELGAAIAT